MLRLHFLQEKRLRCKRLKQGDILQQTRGTLAWRLRAVR
jgi:hypothetical protein